MSVTVHGADRDSATVAVLPDDSHLAGSNDVARHRMVCPLANAVFLTLLSLRFNEMLSMFGLESSWHYHFSLVEYVEQLHALHPERDIVLAGHSLGIVYVVFLA